MIPIKGRTSRPPLKSKVNAVIIIQRSIGLRISGRYFIAVGFCTQEISDLSADLNLNKVGNINGHQLGQHNIVQTVFPVVVPVA